MQQTLLALAAIFVFSLFALSRHQADAELGQRAVGGEIEMAAAGAARDALDHVLRHAFDHADVSAIRVRTAAPTSVIGVPDPGEATRALFNDVDDFHGDTYTVNVPWNGATVPFRISTAVRYVNPLNPDAGSTTPTLAKEVRVTATEVVSGPTGRPEVAVTLQQVVTPASQFLFAR